MALVGRRRQGRRGERYARAHTLGVTLLAGILAALVAAPQAQAVELTDAAGRTVQPYQRWADRSEVPTVRTRVRLQFGDGCSLPWFIACARAVPLSILIEPAGEKRRILLHELGHIFDYLVMGGGVVADGRVANLGTLRTTTARRARFAEIIGRRNSPWTNYSRNSLVEAFAEAYAHCALGDEVQKRHGRERLGHGYNPTRKQHQGVCRLIRRSARSWSGGAGLPVKPGVRARSERDNEPDPRPPANCDATLLGGFCGGE